MDRKHIAALLQQVRNGTLEIPEALDKLRNFPFEDLGFSRIDSHRALRRGFPEVIFCQGKTKDQIVAIAERMRQHGSDVLATRCSAETAEVLIEKFPKAQYFEQSRALVIESRRKSPKGGLVLVVSAGTTDIPVAQEAAVTARALGSRVQELYDVGVAGLHRLLAESPLLQQASVIVVAAGMEGALPSVVSGLVDVPVIAVPTSVGYGASFGGLAALLGMLNSCSAGVVVVNIDNGFGAGYAASMIARPQKLKKGQARKGDQAT
jgi:hypothetical protein